MGLLTVGKALDPAETASISSYIREHGVSQFLSTWNRVKDIANDELRFGDEIECGVLVVDSIERTVKISIRSAELLHGLEEREQLTVHQSEGCTWHPEFGAWMIESTPSRPYTNYASDLLRVERNMTLRRRRLLSALAPNEIAPTVTCFPMMGVGDFIDNAAPFDAPHSMSTLLPDYCINQHPRFAALTTNIRTRRGQKVDISVPLFRDSRTPELLREGGLLPQQSSSDQESYYSISPDKFEVDTNIHMDCMGFGMGMCCLQVTFQGRDVDESRYMYDQLAVLAPIMLAMTAATPVFKGRLADIDVRWTAIAQSVDDRTPVERGAVSLEGLSEEALQALRQPGRAGEGMQFIPKSRYDSVSTYIYHCRGDPNCRRTFEVYNDIPCPVDAATKTRLLAAGIDENLAHHVAHLFTRDPLVVFEGVIELDDDATTEHFENIQSTNWQTCRWKPPPPRTSPSDPHIGWRTEFRSMEVQLTDFENAAFTVFVVLVTRVVLAFDLALYTPLSKVDANMQRAHERDAVKSQKFFFRKHVAPPIDCAAARAHCTSSTTTTSTVTTEVSPLPPAGEAGPYCISTTTSTATTEASPLPPAGEETAAGEGGGESSGPCSGNLPTEDSYEEMSMDEIFHGKGTYYPGLIPLVYAYLDYIDTDPETFQRVDMYLKFISRRAKGETVTTATWMRSFLTGHPEYMQDSIVTPGMAHDLMMACKEVGEGVRPAPEILGDIRIERVRPEDAYGRVLPGKLSAVERSELLARLADRAKTPRPQHVARGRSQSLSTGSQRVSFTEVEGGRVHGAGGAADAAAAGGGLDIAAVARAAAAAFDAIEK